MDIKIIIFTHIAAVMNYVGFIILPYFTNVYNVVIQHEYI